MSSGEPVLKESLARRLLAAALGFIGGSALSMFFFGFIVSIFDLHFASVMPAALVFGLICAILEFCFPGFGLGLFLLVN